MLHTVTFHREKRRLKILAWNDSCDFRATRRQNNTVASEYIPGEKIRLGIEITCLAAIRYRFNSITCFLFIRRFRSHDCFSHRLVSFSFSTLILRARYRMTRSGPWPWKFLCFTRTSITAVHASFRQRPRLSPGSSGWNPLEEREKFSKAMTSSFLWRGCDLVIRASERIAYRPYWIAVHHDAWAELIKLHKWHWNIYYNTRRATSIYMHRSRCNIDDSNLVEIISILHIKWFVGEQIFNSDSYNKQHLLGTIPFFFSSTRLASHSRL